MVVDVRGDRGTLPAVHPSLGPTNLTNHNSARDIQNNCCNRHQPWRSRGGGTIIGAQRRKQTRATSQTHLTRCCIALVAVAN
ncbi:hypothetical protein quinque_000130 [Culex quinquefasciatus]